MKIAVVAMVSMFCVGMTIWLVLYTLYANVLWDVRCKVYKRHLTNVVIKKYVECSRLGIKVGNVARFVDKSVGGYTYCGLSLEMLERVAKAIELIIVLFTLVAAGIIGISGKGACMCIVLGLCEAVAIYICRRLASVGDMRKSIVIAMTSYLKDNSVQLLAADGGVNITQKLTGKAYVDFLRLNQRFDRIYESRNVATLSLKK